MPILLIVLVVAAVFFLATTWFAKGQVAKIVFSLFGVALVAQGCLGALHAWGETGSIPWTVGWLSLAVLFVVLVVLRWRRP